jgi:hypothetical protein
MKKETVYSLLRSVLILVGSFLIGTNTKIFGNPIDATLWEALLGAVLTLAGTLWGIFDKTATIEATQSGIRSVVTFIGGLFVATGKLKAETLVAIIGLITALIPVWQSALARKKVEMINDNRLQVTVEPGKISKNVRPMVKKNPFADQYKKTG